MNWAKDRAAQIIAGQQQEIQEKKTLSAMRSVIALEADSLWEMLVKSLEAHTRDFAASLPEAKRSNLRAERMNQHNLTVSTNTFPIIRFVVIYQPQHNVTGTIEESRSGLLQTKVRQLNPIRFSLDDSMQPCFSDGERFLHPSLVAEELMEEIAKFFEGNARRPILVSASS